LEGLTEGEDVILLIAKTYSCSKLTFEAGSNSSESSIDSNSSFNDSDSDLTDKSELAPPLAE
jgi:hypothetical protein